MKQEHRIASVAYYSRRSGMASPLECVCGWYELVEQDPADPDIHRGVPAAWARHRREMGCGEPREGRDTPSSWSINAA